MNEQREPFDVLVVGGGGSGLAASSRIAELGGRVLVLEKQPQLGGTTGIAVGSFTSSGTSLQRQAPCVESASPPRTLATGYCLPPDLVTHRRARYLHLPARKEVAPFELGTRTCRSPRKTCRPGHRRLNDLRPCHIMPATDFKTRPRSGWGPPFRRSTTAARVPSRCSAA